MAPKSVVKTVKVFMTTLSLLYLTTYAVAATEIPLQKEHGVYKLPVRINGVINLKFILDSGASEVAIPADVAMTLIRTGTITEDDFLPGKSYRMADGSQLKSARLILREMEFGGIKITNVPCSVTPPSADLLLGQSLLEKLHSWKLDNKKHALVVDTDTEVSTPNSPSVESLRPRHDVPKSSDDFDNALAAYKSGDYAVAHRKFIVLADQGDTRAQVDLGIMYSKGEGVPQDYAKAFMWYLKAAERGVFQAQAQVGSLYFKGQGVQQDYAQAATWFRKAAEQGDMSAQYFLGHMYYEGKGVPRDYPESAKWWSKAGEQGNAAAQGMVGILYFKGQGVPQDCVQAAKWLRKSAEQGDMSAQGMLGGLYMSGQGVTQDYVQAYMWFNLAAAQGHSNAQKSRDLVAQQMTPSQIAEAQRLSNEWKPKLPRR
jgi:hypothetical protein